MVKILSTQLNGPYPGHAPCKRDKQNKVILEFPLCEPQLFVKEETGNPYGLGVNHQDGKRYFINLQGTKETRGLPELLVLSPGGPGVSSTKKMTRANFEVCKELFLNNIDTKQILLDNLPGIEKALA
ncbi:MAG: hypothetical protein HY094_00240 [Candidatus Melainabacteria bacterium]|nr:hypothetical protein [Candidatus Melainabacteria bacterium]